MPRVSGAEWDWELNYGCHWNNSLGQWECHGLGGKCRWRWSGSDRRPGPKDWSPRHDRPLADHHAKCEIGRSLAMRKRVRYMKVVVDSTVGRDEIRVADPTVAEWLTKDGEAFHRRVEREAKLHLGEMP